MIEEELTFDNHAGEFEAFLYSPSDRFLGIVRHESSLLAFLCKIKESGSDGYYIVYEGEKYTIGKDGHTPPLFPIHFIDNYLREIVGF